MVNKTVTEEVSNDNRLVSGSAWMTAGSMISRLLGALYIIPWIQWMGGGEIGAAANALYQMAYTPYAFFIALATAGVPSAISKQVSYYNALGEYEISKSIYKQGLKIMALTGVVSAVAMYFLAPVLASSSPSASAQDATIVIRSLTPALLIIPVQSVTRGLIQGHNRMVEPAISQVVEQVVRIIFVLVSVYIIRQVMGGGVVTAVSFSTFAAVVGAIASFVYLLMRLRRIPTALQKAPEESENKVQISTNQVLLEVIKTSIPFVIISTGIILFQLIDQQTYSPLMSWLHGTSDQQIQITYGITQANAHKLSTILTSFGSALAIASVPLISNLMAKNDVKEVRKQFVKALQLLFFIMFPASIGLAVVAEPLYTVFYGYDALGVGVTQVYAFVTIVIASYIVLGNVLQSANQQRPAINAMIVGFIVKIVFQPFTIYLAGPYGMLISTFLGLGITCFLMLRVMYNTIRFSGKFLIRRSALLFLLSAIMGIVTIIARELLGFFINYQLRIPALIGVALLAGIGLIVYGILILKTRIADKLVGTPKAENFRRKLKMS